MANNDKLDNLTKIIPGTNGFQARELRIHPSEDAESFLVAISDPTNGPRTIIVSSEEFLAAAAALIQTSKSNEPEQGDEDAV